MGVEAYRAKPEYIPVGWQQLALLAVLLATVIGGENKAHAFEREENNRQITRPLPKTKIHNCDEHREVKTCEMSYQASYRLGAFAGSINSTMRDRTIDLGLAISGTPVTNMDFALGYNFTLDNGEMIHRPSFVLNKSFTDSVYGKWSFAIQGGDDPSTQVEVSWLGSYAGLKLGYALDLDQQESAVSWKLTTEDIPKKGLYLDAGVEGECAGQDLSECGHVAEVKLVADAGGDLTADMSAQLTCENDDCQGSVSAQVSSSKVNSHITWHEGSDWQAGFRFSTPFN